MKNYASGTRVREMVDHLDELQHELIREALRMGNIRHGVEVTTMGDIPSEGSGLGSSSTVTVGALHAVYAYLGELPSAEKLARQACEIEIEILHAPIGIQDQYIAAYGGLRFVEFRQDGTVGVQSLHLSPDEQRSLNENTMLFFTGITRRAGTILSEQKQNITDRKRALGTLKELAHEARSRLQAGDVDAIGELLHESWQLKKSLASQISNGEIDELYETARKAGAIGGKITGAGGGGFLLLYCPHERQAAVRRALGLQELPFLLAQDGTKIVLNYRR